MIMWFKKRKRNKDNVKGEGQLEVEDAINRASYSQIYRSSRRLVKPSNKLKLITKLNWNRMKKLLRYCSVKLNPRASDRWMIRP